MVFALVLEALQALLSWPKHGRFTGQGYPLGSHRREQTLAELPVPLTGIEQAFEGVGIYPTSA